MKADLIETRLKTLTGWELSHDGKAITRTFSLPGFRAAVAFVAYVAELAEAEDHHPDIDIRYRRVQLTLSTHSAGRLTEKDFRLAALIDGSG